MGCGRCSRCNYRWVSWPIQADMPHANVPSLDAVCCQWWLLCTRWVYGGAARSDVGRRRLSMKSSRHNDQHYEIAEVVGTREWTHTSA